MADLTSFMRQLMAMRNPDAPPQTRYAENRRSRQPTIFRRDIDPDGKVAQRAMQEGALFGAEMPNPEMGEDDLPLPIIGGTFISGANPADELAAARRDPGNIEGPGTVQAYDQMERLLRRGKGHRGVIQIRAPQGAEEAEPIVLRHEEGHALMDPFAQAVEEEAKRRFGIRPETAREAGAYAYESATEDPTGFAHLMPNLLQGLTVRTPEQRQALSQFKRGLRRK